jgi:hypothetical protein
LATKPYGLKKLIALLVLLFSILISDAQTRGFGNIDTADLRLTSCDFEKDANAMVLFDRARVYFSIMGTVTMERHKRIKILNEKGKEQGNVRVEYNNLYGVEHVLNIEAQTLNLDNGKIVVSKIDPKLFYFEHTDKNKDALVISFPNVKEGSVIEYRYTLARTISANFPAWYFQSDIPARYSEFDVYFNSRLKFSALTRENRAFLKDTSLLEGHVWAVSDMPSSKMEAFMRAPGDGLQSVALLLKDVEDYNGKTIHLNDSWSSTGKKLADSKDYYKELDQHLGDEDKLIKQAGELKTDDEKIAFMFNAVKTTISWNGYENWRTADGIKSVWKKRSGNSGEINAILYHLLKKAGIKAYPMLVSTRDNGLLEPAFVDIFQLNHLVTYVPVDSTKYYVLDATNRYYTYNQIPYNLLNSYGLSLNKDDDKYDMVLISTKTPSKEIVVINGEIGPDAKMKGNGEIASYGYNRTSSLELYKTAGEKKFEEYLTENDNSLRLSNLKLGNEAIDTLPLKQEFDFTDDLNNSDNYIFFSPNIFTALHVNPFLSEKRSSEVDFGFANDHQIYGRYKIPAGYNIESLPKDAAIAMGDRSLRFKRALTIEDGYISLHYGIYVTRTKFSKSEYPDLHEFYKRMYDLLNEQIVLKKS